MRRNGSLVLLSCLIFGAWPAARADTGPIHSRASVHTTGTESDDFSFRAAVSADGRYVAFHSRASNLVTGDTNDEDDVFVHDTYSGVSVLVSVSSSGGQGNSDSRDPSISADGRFVTFRSNATNLVPGDGNATWDIFVHDRDADGDGVFDEAGGILTERVSVDSAEVEGNGSCYSSSISGDGRFVAFDSGATNLAGDDPNVLNDVFVRDRQNGTTIRASVSSGGDPADNGGSWPSISADGRWVAFESLANNLVAGDTNLKSDVFVHDLQSGTTVRVSVSTAGGQGDNTSHLFDSHHVISGKGRFVVFSSSATNLVVGDTNNTFDVFAHDRDTDGDGVFDEPGAIATVHVSVDSSGVGGTGQSEHPNVSDDGRFVAFDSLSPLVPDDTGQRDIYVRDLVAGTIVRVSVDPAGAQANGGSTDPTISSGGRFIAFHSSATNLVPGDANGEEDIFVRGLATSLCLDARGPSPELVLFPEPPAGCPQALGVERDFIRGQVSDVALVGAVIRLGPVRCADAGLATLEQVLPTRDPDLAPGQARFYLTRPVGQANFGEGALPGGETPGRFAGLIPCP